jgi:hypothetical protein
MPEARSPYWNPVTVEDGQTGYMELLFPGQTPGSGAFRIDTKGVITAVTVNASGAVRTAGVSTFSAGTDTAPSVPIIASPVAGTNGGSAVQLSDTTRDYMIYLEVGTAGTAMSVTMGSTSAGTDVTVKASGVATAGDIIAFRLPAGWYFKWAATTATLAQSVAVGC